MSIYDNVNCNASLTSHTMFLSIARCIQADQGVYRSFAFHCSAEASSQGNNTHPILPPIGPPVTSITTPGPKPICSATYGCGSRYAAIYTYPHSDRTCSGTPISVEASDKLSTCEKSPSKLPMNTICDNVGKNAYQYDLHPELRQPGFCHDFND